MPARLDTTAVPSQHQEAVQDWEALAVLYGPKRSTRRWGPIQGWHFVTGQSSPFRTAGRGGTHCLREMAMGLSFVQMSITAVPLCFFGIGEWVGVSPMVGDGFQ